MSSYASLLAPLTFSGSRLSDGTPNATGNLHVYLPGTTTPTNVYADPAATILATQPIVLDNGGRIPVATYANGLYVTSPVRIVVKDVTDTVVISDATLIPASAGNVGVSNAGWTGTTVDAVLTAIYASVGGQDGKYKEPSASTTRTIQAKFDEIWVSVKDYGAAGDSVTDDTTAIQNAINRVIAMGGGICYFPPGTYKISAALTVTNAVGVTFLGVGYYASIISQATAATDALTISNGSGVTLRGLQFTGSSTGGSVTITGTTNPTVDTCRIACTGTAGLSASGIIGSMYMIDSWIQGATEAVLFSTSTGFVIVSGGAYGGNAPGHVAFQINGTGLGSFFAYGGVNFGGNVVFGSSVTAGRYVFADCPSLGALGTPIDVSALSGADPGVTQRNCGMDYLAVGSLTANDSNQSVVSSLYTATALTVTGASGSHILSYNLPSPTPPASSKGKRIRIYMINASGTTVTWSAVAGYKANPGGVSLSTTIPTANGTVFSTEWHFDGTNWVLDNYAQAV